MQRAWLSWDRTEQKRNGGNEAVISAQSSRVKVRVIHTDEELMIARSVWRSLDAVTPGLTKPHRRQARPEGRPRNQENIMKATQLLHNLGQSLWLDNITRDLLNSGTLKRYIDQLSVTGLTSNRQSLTTRSKAAPHTTTPSGRGCRPERPRRASSSTWLWTTSPELPTFSVLSTSARARGRWVSLEVSPLLAHDAAGTVAAARELWARAGRPNLFIKIPGTKEGLTAIEETIFAGVPVNVTLLFSREHYLDAARPTCAGSRGASRPASIRRSAPWPLRSSAAGCRPCGQGPPALDNLLGIAVAGRIYKAYVDLLATPRWLRAYNAGALPQRLLWASTGTKDPGRPTRCM